MTTTFTLDRRETTTVGRRARLELVFAVRDGQTRLVESYAEPPFRVGRTFPDAAGGAHLILASSAPGIFSGDDFEQTIRVERGARVRLTSQSALQVHPAYARADRERASARLRQRYEVADDATLHCHWDPLIPFAGASFDQRIGLELADTARLYWSDAFMCGREAYAERWSFQSLSHELRVVRRGGLQYLERFLIQPEHSHPGRPWAGGASCYFGTTLASGAGVTAEDGERVHGDLQQQEWVQAAADLTDDELFVCRLMGNAGPAFHAARSRACALLTPYLLS